MPAELLQKPLWEWWIVVYFFAGGIAGGAYFTSAIIELVGRPEDRPIARMGYYIAFPLSIVCAICLIFDLGQPGRFWRMVAYSDSKTTFAIWPKWDSPISVGAYALLFFGLFSFLSFLDALVETKRLPWAPLRLKYNSVPRLIYAILGGLNGFFLASYTGVLLATTHLPGWTDNPLLGALFLASGASTGMAAIALMLVLTRQKVGESLAKLKRADIVAIIVELLLLGASALLIGNSLQYFMSGFKGLLLIGGTIVLGLLVPLVLQLRGKETAALTVLISLLILGGGFILRTVIVLGGQNLPILSAAAGR